MSRIASRRLLAAVSAVGLMAVAGVVVASSAATAGSRAAPGRSDGGRHWSYGTALGGLGSNHPRGPAAGNLTPARLLGIAEATARSCGDRHPYEIKAVRTTRGAAYRLIWPGAGGSRSDPTPVYAITMRGKFTAYNASIPAGAHPLTGTVISIVVGSTGKLRGAELDFNLTRRPEPDLRALGPVINLGTVERLRTFTGGGVRFRYSASWRAYRWNEFSTMSALIVDLSNQPEHPPCTTHHGTYNTTIRCGEPLRRLKPDSVLAEWSSNGMPGFRLAETPGTPTRIGGRPARVQVIADDCSIGAARSLTAVIGVPGGNSYIEFRACMSGPDPSLQERRVRALLATVHWQ